MDIVELPVDDLLPNDWNPNEQDDETFNNLVQEIEEDGFDEPVLVVEDGEGKYRIIAGEHRWKAVKLLGHSTVPCIVKAWQDEAVQKIKTVRRNNIKGQNNPERLRNLFRSVMQVPGHDPETLKRAMGFTSSDDRIDKILEDVAPSTAQQVAKLVKESSGKIESMENLSFILNKLFQEYGEDLQHSFMFFTYGKRLHLMVEMDKPLHGVMNALAKATRSAGGSIAYYLAQIISGKATLEELVSEDEKNQDVVEDQETLSDEGGAADSDA